MPFTVKVNSIVRVSYNKLRKLLIDKKMNKTELRLSVGASSATMAKLSKEVIMSMDTLSRICEVLHCNVGDIMDFVTPNFENGGR